MDRDFNNKPYAKHNSNATPLGGGAMSNSGRSASRYDTGYQGNYRGGRRGGRGGLQNNVPRKHPYGNEGAPRNNQYNRYENEESGWSSSNRGRPNAPGFRSHQSGPHTRPNTHAPLESRTNDNKGNNFEAQKEYPVRCLFVRNLEHNISEEEVMDLFLPYGEVKTVYNKISQKGVIYITYFDIRAAKAAKEGLNEHEINGKPIDIHFSFPKADTDFSQPPEHTHNQGSIKAFFASNGNRIPKEEQLYEYFSQFGELHDVHFTKQDCIKIIVYYDTRACLDALQFGEPNFFAPVTFTLTAGWDRLKPPAAEYDPNFAQPSKPKKASYSMAPKHHPQPNKEYESQGYRYNQSQYEQAPLNDINQQPYQAPYVSNGFRSATDSYAPQPQANRPHYPQNQPKDKYPPQTEYNYSHDHNARQSYESGYKQNSGPSNQGYVNSNNQQRQYFNGSASAPPAQPEVGHSNYNYYNNQRTNPPKGQYLPTSQPSVNSYHQSYGGTSTNYQAQNSQSAYPYTPAQTIHTSHQPPHSNSGLTSQQGSFQGSVPPPPQPTITHGNGIGSNNKNSTSEVSQLLQLLKQANSKHTSN